MKFDREKSAWEEERLRYRRDLKSFSGEKQVLLMERDTLAREVGDLKAQIDTLSQEVTRVIKHRSLEVCCLFMIPWDQNEIFMDIIFCPQTSKYRTALSGML